jgi:hypothetical protein
MEISREITFLRHFFLCWFARDVMTSSKKLYSMDHDVLLKCLPLMTRKWLKISIQ